MNLLEFSRLIITIFIVIVSILGSIVILNYYNITIEDPLYKPKLNRKAIYEGLF